jgi:hypothetical protein
MTKLVDFCNRYNDDHEIDSDVYEELNNLINIEFQNSPFNICLSFNKLKNLDKPFTPLHTIIIIDGRITDSNPYYSGVYESELIKLHHELVIESIDNKPITLRQVLTCMITNDHYNMSNICRDHHRFLEGFRPTGEPHVFKAYFAAKYLNK